MTDLVGTVRRENRKDDGSSIWQLISTYEEGTRWVCVWSTTRSNSGSDPDGFSRDIERFTTVIGVVPGTPAADQ